MPFDEHGPDLGLEMGGDIIGRILFHGGKDHLPDPQRAERFWLVPRCGGLSAPSHMRRSQR